MKYIPSQRQPCNLYEIHILTGTTLGITLNTYPYRDKLGNYMKYTLTGTTWKLHEIHTLTEPTLEIT